jgi:ribosome biogenesis GTPase A
MTVSASSNISQRNTCSVQLVRNFEITRRGLKYSGDSYQRFDMTEGTSKELFPYQSFGKQRGITREKHEKVTRLQLTVLGSPKVGKTSLIQRLRRSKMKILAGK